VAYVILVIFLLAASGFAFFLGQPLLQTNNASLAQSFFAWHPWIYIVLAPAVGMRLWSEEQRLGTLELLLTMPVSPWHAIMGKFMAASVVWLLGLALTFPMVWTVFYLGDPDPGPIVTGYIASFLFAIAVLAVTSAVSAVTNSQVVCFIVSVAMCFLICLLGVPSISQGALVFLPDSLAFLVRGITYLSFLDHYYELTKGVIYARDVLYFLSIIVVSLLITNEAIRIKRA
jgi:ABC-2 type transport system permease protein